MESIEKYRDSVFIGVAELAAAANDVLGKMDFGKAPANTVRLPNERTIRYYLTEGLLPPADASEGTSSVFSFRHLVTLILIKRLQAFGLSNRTIRRVLEGRNLVELEKLLEEPISISRDQNDAIKAAERGEIVVTFTEPEEINEIAALMETVRSRNNAEPQSPIEEMQNSATLSQSDDVRNEDDYRIISEISTPRHSLMKNKIPARKDSDLPETVFQPAARLVEIPGSRMAVKPERWERYSIADGVELNFSEDSALTRKDKLQLVETLRNKLRTISGHSRPEDLLK